MQRFPYRGRFGAMLPQRKTMSAAYLPPLRDRMALGRRRIPYWHIINYDLAAQESLDDRILPDHQFVLTMMMATSVQAAGFRSQSFQLANEQGEGFPWSRIGINQANSFGTAARPFILSHPHPMPNLFSLMNRTANMALATDPDDGENTVQLAFYGLRDLDNVGAVINR